ncbi:hypothetical protein CLI77_10655 [Porphyromonas gingivalis]|nr:hypothetical protein CLI77_10655 [Porphyromonas gingivalis]PDP63267.1 hypothetical protein CLI80_09735 [Porphyromonas gingivalis]PDP63642.1 hypothetical protein CLI80_08970 [Porphyromonas gingivalis]PDP63714.1 hypothetical protein CLI80_08595 [Porphyromonas gingivalis]PDP63778.1 hypothetical protein CLI80_08235 [Porphyromonas gingivalis]
MSTAKIQIIRYFFKHNAHVLWAFTTNQKTNSLAFSWSIGQIAGYYFHVVVLWVKLQATVLGVCWAIFLSL